MRYYDILVSNADGSQYQNCHWSSLGPDGLPDFGALNIEFDIPIYDFSRPAGMGHIIVWGVGLPLISQAAQLNNKTITIRGGMSKGLPLANPTQAGQLSTGTIFQSYGNWQGTNQTLEMIFYPNTGSNETPVNISLNWKAGTTLASALATTLKAAFPVLKQNINISNNLILPNDQPGIYKSLQQFAAYVSDISQKIIGGNYKGVSITIAGNSINVSDGTVTSQAKQIAFQDLIGQPVWQNLFTIQLHCVLRGDIAVNDYISLPPVIATTTSASNSQARTSNLFTGSGLSFSGMFQVVNVRAVGNFRLPNAESWITVIDAVAQTPATTTPNTTSASASARTPASNAPF